MANLVPLLNVDDTSPTIQYSPFRDTFSTPDFTAGWNPLFNQTSIAGAPLPIQNSTSVHVTSLDNASLSLQWQGTAIQLWGYATNASYTILVDGVPQAPNSSQTVLASIENLNNTNHEISLTTIISNATPNQTQSFIVFDKAVITAPPTFDSNSTATFSPQSLNDSDISFQGEWGIKNSSTGGSTLTHFSDTVNDSASAEFNGTAFQLFGTVLPEGGNYTVQLDDSTPTQFSAQASFIQDNTLLFFTNALDPYVPHSVRIVNNGGTLMLSQGGFKAVTSGDPNLVSPTGTSPAQSATASAAAGATTENPGLSKGTIAALVLAGVLAFLIISGLLFCIFVWRPMKIRQRQARRRMMEREDGRVDDVLDIGRHDPSYMDHSPANSGGTRRTRGSQKSSGGRSGFLRWKREMESGNGGKVLGALGLVFRHSDSPQDKQSGLDDLDVYGEPAGSTKSLSPSSAGSGGSVQSKDSKGKNRWRKSQKDTPSPSYTIDLPPLSRSREQIEERVSPADHRSFSGLTSLTYMSTPDTENSRELSFNAPSSHPSNPSQRPSASPNHERTDSNGMLLLHNDGDSKSEAVSEVDYHSSIVSTHQDPDTQVHVHELEVQSTYPSSRSGNESRRPPSSYTREIDRGSVRTNDDGLSVLGAATARAAIRSLSPRTSELVFTNPSLDRLLSSALPPQDETRVPRERLLSDQTARPDDSLDARARSPFRLEPAKRTSVSASRKSTGFSVRFEDEDDDTSSSDENKKGKGKEKEKEKEKGKEKEKEPTGLRVNILLTPAGLSQGPKAAFRLTPQRPITSPVSEADSNLTTSFLDLSGSNSNSDSSQREPSITSQRMGLRSRWSATTAATATDPDSHNPRQESSGSQGSGISASAPSSNFPFPVSLPASPHHPEGFKPSPPASPLWEAASPPGQLNVNPSTHPFGINPNPASPSDSVPMSISDLHFRHSDSENEELMTANPSSGPGSHLPPHPPLPSVPPTPTFPPPIFPPPRIAITTASTPTEPLSSPGYIVSRVFPRSQSGSGTDPLSPPAHRTFGNS